jgi:hypothetical protein
LQLSLNHILFAEFIGSHKEKFMIKVKLDIAGMYYDIEVLVPIGATVEDVMKAAHGRPNDKGAVLYYKTESSSGEANVDIITIHHNSNSAVSRQIPKDGEETRRYAEGVYTFADDGAIEGGRFVSLDKQKNFVHAWQYYVYNADFVDQSRKNGGSVPRKIVGFGVTENKGYELEEGSTIVWRLVTIFVGPTLPPYSVAT